MKKIIVPPFSELFVNSFGDKAQDNQDSHFSHDSGEKETKQGNGLHFPKVVYIEEAMQRIIPNIHVQGPYHIGVHKSNSNWCYLKQAHLLYFLLQLLSQILFQELLSPIAMLETFHSSTLRGNTCYGFPGNAL